MDFELDFQKKGLFQIFLEKAFDIFPGNTWGEWDLPQVSLSL